MVFNVMFIIVILLLGYFTIWTDLLVPHLKIQQLTYSSGYIFRHERCISLLGKEERILFLQMFTVLTPKKK